jgi:hypothetical protein
MKSPGKFGSLKSFKYSESNEKSRKISNARRAGGKKRRREGKRGIS